MSRYEGFDQISEEITQLMENLCQTGFDTVSDSVLTELDQAAAAGIQFGLEYLAELLMDLKRSLEERRHRLKGEAEDITVKFCRINEYLYLCRWKTDYDKAEEYYEGEKSYDESTGGTYPGNGTAV